MALHPVFQTAFEAARAAGKPALSGAGVAAAREAVDAGAKPLGPGPEVLRVEDVRIPRDGVPVLARVYRPSEHPDGVIVYFHGGGWVAGSVQGFDGLARALAMRCNCTVVSVEYRLAPEHPYPAGLEDARVALRWASVERASLARPGAGLIVAGDSAGANLATVAALRMAGELDIALQLLFYPVTGCDFDTDSYRQWAEGLSLTREDMRWFFSNYAPENLWDHPDIAPLHADLRGAPPVWLAVAQYDVLRTDGEAYADRLRQAGVAVQSCTWEDLTHGFARWFNLVDSASQALDDAARAVRAALQAR